MRIFLVIKIVCVDVGHYTAAPMGLILLRSTSPETIISHPYFSPVFFIFLILTGSVLFCLHPEEQHTHSGIGLETAVKPNIAAVLDEGITPTVSTPSVFYLFCYFVTCSVVSFRVLSFGSSIHQRFQAWTWAA
jgi:hypothetical protein